MSLVENAKAAINEGDDNKLRALFVPITTLHTCATELLRSREGRCCCHHRVLRTLLSYVPPEEVVHAFVRRMSDVHDRDYLDHWSFGYLMHVCVMSYFVRALPSVRVVDECGWTMLHWACAHGDGIGYRIAMSLVSRGADIYAINDDGLTAIDILHLFGLRGKLLLRIRLKNLSRTRTRQRKRKWKRASSYITCRY